jgi:hypothetical protein
MTNCFATITFLVHELVGRPAKQGYLVYVETTQIGASIGWLSEKARGAKQS